MAKKNSTRLPISGIVVIDKPLNMSSNHCLQKAKGIFFAQKAGHTGSLDPLATGVLPICFGEATKFSQYLLDADKLYQFSVKLGVCTTTGDSEGEVIERLPVKVSLTDVEQALSEFRGSILQTPPMYSALKQNGQPLYKLARAGKIVERQSRPVEIYRLDLIHFEGDSLQLEVSCSKGTYVRSLAEDIGKKLGCGAYVTALRRLKAGCFSLFESCTLERLQELKDQNRGLLEATLLPVDSGIDYLPKVDLQDCLSSQILQGKALSAPDPMDSGLVRLYRGGVEFIGLGEIIEGKLLPRRLLSC